MSRFAILATLALASTFASCGGKSPEETVVRFLESVKAGDVDAASLCLIEADREGASGPADGGPESWTVGKTETDGDQRIVHVAVTEAGREDNMPFVLVQESGEWRISMEKTMERMLGFSMEEMKEGFEGMAEAMGEEFQKGLEELDAEIEPAIDESGDR